MTTIRFSGTHLATGLVVLATEVFIALEVHDRIVRPFVGDVLVVPLVYCMLASVIRARRLALGVVLFAFCVEVLQAFDYVALLHLEHDRMLSIAMGRTFEWTDFAAYAVGYLLVLGAGRLRNAAPLQLAR